MLDGCSDKRCLYIWIANSGKAASNTPKCRITRFPVLICTRRVNTALKLAKHNCAIILADDFPFLILFYAARKKIEINIFTHCRNFSVENQNPLALIFTPMECTNIRFYIYCIFINWQPSA